MLYRKSSLLVEICLLGLLPLLATSQSLSTAQLSGEITDQTGAPLSGVKINIIDNDRNQSRTAISNSAGHYILLDLPVAAYHLQASAQGFKTFKQTSIVLHVGDNREINFAMQRGAEDDSITKKGGANLIQSEQDSVSQVISLKNIVELPLNGREAAQLVLISGASTVTPPQGLTGSKSFIGSATVSVAGGQGNQTNYFLDGGDNVDALFNINLPFPFPDALQEFGVYTNSLPAQDGRLPGGLVTIVTKSGGNSFHGDFFEFLRNGDLNARNAFAARQDTLKRNQFGATIGGHIIKDKLFFFAGYQGTRVVSTSNSNIEYVPTPLELLGNFSVQESAACQSSHTNKTLTGYPGNMIPVSKFDPAALKFLSYMPTSSDPCGKVVFGISSSQTIDEGIGKLDWVQSPKHTISLRAYIPKSLVPPPFDPQNLGVTQSPGVDQIVESATIGDTYVFKPTLVNSFHFTFDRHSLLRSPASGMPNAASLGVNVYNPVSNDLRLAVSNDFATECTACTKSPLSTNSFQTANSTEWVHGKHHAAFGGDFIRTQINAFAVVLQNGNYAFNGSTTGDPMSDFLTGSLSTFQQGRPLVPTDRQSIIGLFAQDSFRLSPRLTIDAGLRWEPSLYTTDIKNRTSFFSLTNFLNGTGSSAYTNSPAGALYYADTHNTSFANNHYANFSPRLGIALDPKGNGKQTIRLGVSQMFDSAAAYGTQRVASNPPFINEIDLTTSAPGGFSNPWTTGYNYPGGNPFPGTGATFPNFATWVFGQPNIKPTNVWQWNATYQFQIGADWVFSGSYIGNKTSHLWLDAETNPALYSPAICAQFAKGCSTSNTNQRRLLDQMNPVTGKYYGPVEQLSSDANASYHALIVSGSHRLTRGISVISNYTWSHCISEGETYGDVSSPGFSNPFNLAADRGNCNYDLRQIFNASVIGTTPAMEGNRIVRALTGNWQIAPLFRAASGVPLNVLTGSDRSLSGVGLDRPNLVAGVSPYYSGPDSLQYLNPTAFQANAPGTFGNLGRDALHGPGSLNIDLSVTRIIPVRERYRMEIRGEAFNVINHTNYLAPATSTGISGISTSGIPLTISSSTFGRITSAGDPRILQLAMKLFF